MGSNPKVRQLEGLIKKAAKKYEGMPIALSGGIDSGLLAALIKPKFAINVLPYLRLAEEPFARTGAKPAHKRRRYIHVHQ